MPVGNWRDSSDGLGGGSVPFDVNVALVPAALRDAARLLDTGWFSGATDERHEPGLTLADDARALASAWTGTDHHFTVTITADQARANLASIGNDRGLPNRFITDALGTISDEPVTFPGIALDAEGTPVPVMHGDDSLVLLFGDPSPHTLHQIADRLTAPFPAGLRLPGAGTLVANPVHAGEDLRARFTAGHYHGTVIWSWPQAAYAAGIARQIDRPDLPATTRARLIAAEAILCRASRLPTPSAPQSSGPTRSMTRVPASPFPHKAQALSTKAIRCNSGVRSILRSTLRPGDRTASSENPRNTVTNPPGLWAP